MRYLILSDIHANIDALDEVLAAVPASAYDRVLVLGDLVGYGAEPNIVVERVAALGPAAMVRGNHDKVASGLETAEGFNPAARRSAAWTREVLTEQSRERLRALDRGPVLVDDLTEICHGSPAGEDTYIFGEPDAAEALAVSRRPLCLFGHTHMPLAAALTTNGNVELLFHGPRDEHVLELVAGCSYLVNPGSIGQPRDGDPRAAFALLDTERRRLVVRRLAYAVDRACQRVVAAGLPRPLAERLKVGR